MTHGDATGGQEKPARGVKQDWVDPFVRTKEKMVDEVVLTRPMIRLIGTLISDLPEARTEYSKTELAVCAGIGYATIHRIWPTIECLQLVIPARKEGVAELFRANPHSKILQRYRDLVRELVSIEMGQ